jgi:hypothetical protein
MIHQLKQDVSRKLLPLIAGWHPAMQDMVLALAEYIDHAKPCAAIATTGVGQSTWSSRCARQRLSSPKVIHQHLRLYAALILAGQKRTLTEVSTLLGSSTVQSFSRIIRDTTGQYSRDFIRTQPDAFWSQFITDVLRPGSPGWRRIGKPESLVAA